MMMIYLCKCWKRILLEKCWNCALKNISHFTQPFTHFILGKRISCFTFRWDKIKRHEFLSSTTQTERNKQWGKLVIAPKNHQDSKAKQGHKHSSTFRSPYLAICGVWRHKSKEALTNSQSWDIDGETKFNWFLTQSVEEVQFTSQLGLYCCISSVLQDLNINQDGSAAVPLWIETFPCVVSLLNK